jgi:NADH-quinone oxidoreductase subunit E
MTASSFQGRMKGLAADVVATTPDEHAIDEAGGTPAQHQELSAVDTTVFDGVRERAAAIIARYPEPRSALLPLLHLVQYVEGHVGRAGIAFCAEVLEITTAEVSAVATFYTMYKREPVGQHLVSVCTNTLCAALGGDDIYRAVGEQLGEPGAPLGHERTSGEPGTEGSITLEHAECLAACDLAPVLTVNYEFFDRQTVASATEIVEALRRGEKPHPTRGAPLTDFRRIELLLAGFFDDPEVGGLEAVAGPSADEASLRGARLAEEQGWQAPPLPEKAEPTTNPHAGGPS